MTESPDERIARLATKLEELESALSRVEQEVDAVIQADQEEVERRIAQ